MNANPSTGSTRIQHRQPARAYAVDTNALVDIVTAKVSRSATAEILQREERRGKRNAVIFSVLGMIGFGGVTGVASWKIETAVEAQTATLQPTIAALAAEEVSRKIGQVEQRLRETESLQEFIESARKLGEDEDGFSPGLRDDLMASIRTLAATGLVGSSRFLGAMREVTARFAAAGLDEEVDEIDTLVGASIRRDRKIALDLSDHYGENIIGSPLPIERNSVRIERMRKYLLAATVEGYPEKQKMWELFIEFRRQGLVGGPVTDGIVESIADLDERDRRQFYRFVKLYSDPGHWQHMETQEGREMARLVSALLAQYPGVASEIELLASRLSAAGAAASL